MKYSYLRRDELSPMTLSVLNFHLQLYLRVTLKIHALKVVNSFVKRFGIQSGDFRIRYEKRCSNATDAPDKYITAMVQSVKQVKNRGNSLLKVSYYN